jgi:hypothetical protein
MRPVSPHKPYTVKPKPFSFALVQDWEGRGAEARGQSHHAAGCKGGGAGRRQADSQVKGEKKAAEGTQLWKAPVRPDEKSLLE